MAATRKARSSPRATAVVWYAMCSTVTGKVDKTTYDKLMSSDAKAYIMHQGDKCEMVKEIQAVLKEKGFLDSDPTGQCGEKTIAAVKAFQKSKGLTEDGNAGPGTLTALFGY